MRRYMLGAVRFGLLCLIGGNVAQASSSIPYISGNDLRETISNSEMYGSTDVVQEFGEYGKYTASALYAIIGTYKIVNDNSVCIYIDGVEYNCFKLKGHDGRYFIAEYYKHGKFVGGEKVNFRKPAQKK